MLNERDEAIAQTLIDLVAGFLEMRKRGINVRLVLPDDTRLQASLDGGECWFNVDDDYDVLDLATHYRLSHTATSPEAKIAVQVLWSDS